jgi:hypothetical protein
MLNLDLETLIWSLGGWDIYEVEMKQKNGLGGLYDESWLGLFYFYYNFYRKEYLLV